jgi:hypothetical protein
MLAFIKKLLLALFLFVVLIFVYENMAALSQTVPFVFDLFVKGYRYESPALPVWILFAVFFLLGMLTAGFHGVYERVARHAEIRKRDKRIRDLGKEVAELRVQVAELRPPPAAGSATQPGTRQGEDQRETLPPPSAPEEEPTL